MNNKKMTTKEDIQELISLAKTFHKSEQKDKEIYDLFLKDLTYNKIFQQLIKNLVKWRFHQVQMEEENEFEICIQLNECIEIEIIETKRLLNKYFILDKDERELILQIKEKSIERGRSAWKNYKQTINK